MENIPERITAENVKQSADAASTIMQSKEELENPYVCEICKRRFKNSSGLRGHMVVHKVETIDSVTEEEEKDEDPTQWIKMYAKDSKVTNSELIKLLSLQPQVTFIIPEDPYDSSLTRIFGLNGQLFEFPVGQYIVLPRDIVTQIKGEYKETELAKRQKLINAQNQSALTR